MISCKSVLKLTCNYHFENQAHTRVSLPQGPELNPNIKCELGQGAVHKYNNGGFHMLINVLLLYISYLIYSTEITHFTLMNYLLVFEYVGFYIDFSL